MAARLNLITAPDFVALQPLLLERMAQIGAEIHAEQFAVLLDPLLREIIKRGFADAGAHEGTLWLVDAAGEFLEPAHTVGPHAEKIVGHFKQPLGAGLISMVFATEQPFLENEVSKNAQQSKLLDSLLHEQTQSLIAIPFHFLNGCRGVVSCVQFKSPDAETAPPLGFHAPQLAHVQRTTALVAQIIEYRLLSRTVGWTCE